LATLDKHPRTSKVGNPGRASPTSKIGNPVILRTTQEIKIVFMPIPEKYLADFQGGEIYHVYNRTNNKENLFVTDENRTFFLKRYKEIVASFVDTFCWNLLPNHFHLLIRIKSEEAIIAYLESKPTEALTGTERKFLRSGQRVANLSSAESPRRVANLSKVGNPESPDSTKVDNPDSSPNVGTTGDKEITVSELIEQTFKRFFQSYALAFNKQHKRQGNLFYKPFKRVKIESDSQLTMAIIYVHANAAKHNLVKDFIDHPWTSWHSLMSGKPTSLSRDEIIKWFGSIELCIKTHLELAETYYNCEIEIED
jgi:hypothetical protein